MRQAEERVVELTDLRDGLITVFSTVASAAPNDAIQGVVIGKLSETLAIVAMETSDAVAVGIAERVLAAACTMLASPSLKLNKLRREPLRTAQSQAGRAVSVKLRTPADRALQKRQLLDAFENFEKACSYADDRDLRSIRITQAVTAKALNARQFVENLVGPILQESRETLARGVPDLESLVGRLDPLVHPTDEILELDRAEEARVARALRDLGPAPPPDRRTVRSIRIGNVVIPDAIDYDACATEGRHAAWSMKNEEIRQSDRTLARQIARIRISADALVKKFDEALAIVRFFSPGTENLQPAIDVLAAFNALRESSSRSDDARYRADG